MTRDLVFLYPGQGCQHVGMGAELCRISRIAADYFEKAKEMLGFPLDRVCLEGPEHRLNSDVTAQLAVYTVSCIMTEEIMGRGVLPSFVTGYSSGFYAAAYAAGCFTFREGLALVKRAGELLLKEGEKIDGKMAVIFGISAEQVEGLCREVGGVDTAIINTPRQIIISGIKARVEEVMSRAADRGALDVYGLPALVPYHSRFMEKSAERLTEEIRFFSIKDPKIPLISYLTLEPVPDKDTLKGLIAGQLSRTVFWSELISTILTQRTPLFVEAGPGKVLTRALKWIDRNAEVLSLSEREGLAKIEEAAFSGSPAETEQEKFSLKY